MMIDNYTMILWSKAKESSIDMQAKQVFDVNYLGKDIISHLKICEEVLSKVYEYEKIDGGYYIRFQKDPIDITNKEHIELQKEINHLFGI